MFFRASGLLSKTGKEKRDKIAFLRLFFRAFHAREDFSGKIPV